MSINNGINTVYLICAANNEVSILKICSHLVMDMIDNRAVMKDICTTIT